MELELGTQHKAVMGRRTVPIADPFPLELVAVRHGQSLANIAFSIAESERATNAQIDGPDAQVPLSDKGRWQSERLGHWLAGTDGHLPDIVFCSPFRRAQETIRIALSNLPAGAVPEVHTDSRLADRDMGAFELMTPAYISQKHPEEAARRERLGEMKYHPPDGESMGDVATRVGHFLSDVNRLYRGQRVLVVGHDAVVLMMRFAIENLNEQDLWSIEATHPVANAAVTRWRPLAGRLTLSDYNCVKHLGEYHRQPLTNVVEHASEPMHRLFGTEDGGAT